MNYPQALPPELLADESLRAKFYARFTPAEPGSCWPWTGARTPYGLLNIRVHGRATTINASRVALALKLGRWPGPGLLACHKCNNPPCVNPEHLYEGTPSQNAADRKRALARKECAHA